MIDISNSFTNALCVRGRRRRGAARHHQSIKSNQFDQIRERMSPEEAKLASRRFGPPVPWWMSDLAMEWQLSYGWYRNLRRFSKKYHTVNLLSSQAVKQPFDDSIHSVPITNHNHQQSTIRNPLLVPVQYLHSGLDLWNT
jgi:hypothetical protein